jgi:lipopolysaccharide transport system permease protein
MGRSPMQTTTTVITADDGRTRLDLGELLQYRDLLLVLAYRDYRVRYAQTFLGLAWAFLQPTATLLIFSIVFGRAMGIDTGAIPYPLFAVCGMAAWSYFAYVVSQSGTSIIGAQEMIKKIYFPRLVIPLSKAVVGFIDFGITALLILALMLYYGVAPSPHIVFLPLFAGAGVVAALAVGIWTSTLTIRYRDFQHVVPFVVQMGLYATPVAYPAALVTDVLPGWAGVVYYLNPMAGITEGFRWAVLGTNPPNPMSYLSLGITFILLLGGLFYFKSVERTMADLV